MRKGFTLLELLVVIGIGAASAAGFFTYFNAVADDEIYRQLVVDLTLLHRELIWYHEHHPQSFAGPDMDRDGEIDLVALQHLVSLGRLPERFACPTRPCRGNPAQGRYQLGTTSAAYQDFLSLEKDYLFYLKLKPSETISDFWQRALGPRLRHLNNHISLSSRPGVPLRIWISVTPLPPTEGIANLPSDVPRMLYKNASQNSMYGSWLWAIRSE